MFNVGGGELLVIFLVALIVLGPAKLPEVARQVGGVMREIRRISSGFQDEMRAAMDDPVEAAARERGNRVVATSESPAPTTDIGDELDDDPDSPEDDADDADDADDGEGVDQPDDLDGSDAIAPSAPAADEEPDSDAGPAPMSTAAAAGMYDVAPPTSTPNPYLASVGTRAQPVDDGTRTPAADAADEHMVDASDEGDEGDEGDDAASPDGTTDER
jgi:Tat protein translocase TatB subunit